MICVISGWLIITSSGTNIKKILGETSLPDSSGSISSTPNQIPSETSVIFSTNTPKIFTTGTSAIPFITVEKIYEFTQPTDLQLVLDFSPDGELLASSGWDRIIRIWNVKTGEVINEFPALVNKYVQALAFSPDGQVLASGGSEEGRIMLWDVATGLKSGSLDGHTSEVTSIDFSPDERFLASGSCCSGSAENSVRIWDVASRKEIKIVDILDEPILDITYNPTGDILAVSGRDGFLTLWRTDDWSEQISYPTTVYGQVLFSDNGKSFFGAGWDNNIWVLDLTDGINPRKLEGHTDWVSDVSLNHSEQLLASAGGFDLSLRIWDLNSKTEIWKQIFDEEVFAVTNVEFSPSGNYLAVCVGPKVLLYEIIY